MFPVTVLVDYQCRTGICHSWTHFSIMLKQNVKITVKAQVFYSMNWNYLSFLWIAVLRFCSIKQKTIGYNRYLHMLAQLPVLCLYLLVIYQEKFSHLCEKSFSKRIIVLCFWFHSTSHSKIYSPRSLRWGPASSSSKSWRGKIIEWFASVHHPVPTNAPVQSVGVSLWSLHMPRSSAPLLTAGYILYGHLSSNN